MAARPQGGSRWLGSGRCRPGPCGRNRRRGRAGVARRTLPAGARLGAGWRAASHAAAKARRDQPLAGHTLRRELLRPTSSAARCCCCACAIPWFAGSASGPGGFDPPGILAAVLVSLAAGHCAGRRCRRGPSPSGCLLVPCAAWVAVLAANAGAGLDGLAAATAAAVATARPAGAAGRHRPWSDAVRQHHAARCRMPACVTLLVGLGCLAAARAGTGEGSPQCSCCACAWNSGRSPDWIRC